MIPPTLDQLAALGDISERNGGGSRETAWGWTSDGWIYENSLGPYPWEDGRTPILKLEDSVAAEMVVQLHNDLAWLLRFTFDILGPEGVGDADATGPAT